MADDYYRDLERQYVRGEYRRRTGLGDQSPYR